MTLDMQGKRKMLLLSKSDKNTKRRGQSPWLLLTSAQSVQFLSKSIPGQHTPIALLPTDSPLPTVPPKGHS